MRIYSPEGSNSAAIAHDFEMSRRDSIARHNADLIRRHSRRKRLKHALGILLAPVAVIVFVDVMTAAFG